jgi:hypothetical protein
MDTDNEMNRNGCFIEHEALIIDEYGEQVTSAGWNLLLARAGNGRAAPRYEHANVKFAEVLNDDGGIISSILPKCP